MLITPSGMPYEDLTPANIVYVDSEGGCVHLPNLSVCVSNTTTVHELRAKFKGVGRTLRFASGEFLTRPPCPVYTCNPNALKALRHCIVVTNCNSDAYATTTTTTTNNNNTTARYYGPLLPSSEWRMHFDIYRSRPEAMAVVHAHPTYCTALSAQNKGIPSFHYMVAMAGAKEIKCAKVCVCVCVCACLHGSVRAHARV
jgi:ribulose-5-phosphate 4-epimerase/fuculose-1-phosphate aldolase